jgi:outer membrane protein assembly factor BamB
VSNGYLDVWAPNDPEEVPVLDPWAHDESGAPVLGIRDRLRALDPDDGTVLWETEAPDLMSRAVVGDVLVASDDESTTLGLDVMTGRVLWTAPVTGEGVATDGELLLLSSGVVLRLADGAVVRDGDGTGWPPLGRSRRLAAVGETLTLYGW